MLDFSKLEIDEWQWVKNNSLSRFEVQEKLSGSVIPRKDLLASYALYILLSGYPDEAYEWTEDMRNMHDRMLNTIIDDNKF